VVDTLVQTRGLTKRYGKRIVAVENLDLTVRRGEVYGFLGPNGAGKTTTLRMLLGLIRPSSGTATVLGEEPGAPAGLARVGALVESPAFYPYLSGRDNLRVMARYAWRSALPNTRGPGAGRTVGEGERQIREVLPGHEAAARGGSGPAQGPGALDPGRADQRPGPQGMADMRALVRRLGQGNRTVLCRATC
jgi:ABC-2 type transport system ATP-binding protein